MFIAPLGTDDIPFPWTFDQGIYSQVDCRLEILTAHPDFCRVPSTCSSCRRWLWALCMGMPLPSPLTTARGGTASGARFLYPALQRLIKDGLIVILLLSTVDIPALASRSICSAPTMATSDCQKLFLTQCDNRVNATRSPRREITGRQSHHHQNGQGACGDSRVRPAMLNGLPHRVHACRHHTHNQHCQRDANA